MSGSRAAVHWPADRFYWAVIDTTPLGRGATAPSQEQLAFLMEPTLPVALEAVHCAFVRVGPRRYVGCAADRARLDALRRDQPDAEMLVPESPPEAIRSALEHSSGEVGERLPIERLNLLTGDYEAPAVRTLRRRVGVELAALVALVLIGLVVGVTLRRAAYADAAAATDEARRSRITTVLGSTLGMDDRSGLPPELRLISELRTLEQRAGGAGSTTTAMPRDASPTLAALLAAWPEGIDATFESLVVGDDTINVRGIAIDATAAQRVAEALATIDGWRLEQPQFRSSRERISFTIDLRRRVVEVAP